MTTKTKLTVVTPLGTFTRTTARTYSHIVVAIGERAEVLKARSAASLAYDVKLKARYEIDKHGPEAQVMNYAGTEKLHDFAAYIAQIVKRMEAEPARLAAELAANEKSIANRAGYVLAWCGRPDLAQKEAAKFEARGFIVSIHPVTTEVA